MALLASWPLQGGSRKQCGTQRRAGLVLSKPGNVLTTLLYHKT